MWDYDPWEPIDKPPSNFDRNYAIFAISWFIGTTVFGGVLFVLTTFEEIIHDAMRQLGW